MRCYEIKGDADGAFASEEVWVKINLSSGIRVRVLVTTTLSSLNGSP